MEKLDYKIECGKRSIDDDKRISIPGQLIVCPGSKKLLLGLAGWKANYRDYLQHFADRLGTDYNVYMTQLRNKGFANVDNCARDLVQIEQNLRKALGLEDVIYIGHSMSMNVAARARHFGNSQVRGFYGICAYPSLGDSRTRSSDLDEKGIQQTIIDFASKLNWSLIGAQLKEHLFKEPVRFAIAGNDELLDIRRNPQVLKRFLKYFNRNPKASTRVFEGRNHCFNYTPWDFIPFNKDNPDLLVDDIKNFASGI